MDKIGHMSDAEVASIREVMTGLPMGYMRYFYEDALWALKSGRPFKSTQREQAEARYLKLKVLTEWRVRENEELMRKIALRQPIDTGGTTIVFDETRIQIILASMSASSKRIEVLFTRPPQKK